MTTIDIQYVKGVGEKRAKLLEKLGIFTVEDAVRYYPRAYLDFANCKPIAALVPGETACVRAVVGTELFGAQIRKGLTIWRSVLTDGAGTMHLIIFNNRFLAERLKQGETYLFYGKVTENYGTLEMNNPLVEEDCENAGFLPVYPLTAGISRLQLSRIIQNALKLWLQEEHAELLPEAVRHDYSLCRERYALTRIHAPVSLEEVQIARRRLIFEELFVLQCGMALLRVQGRQRSAFCVDTAFAAEFLEQLPFTLTGAQNRAVADCLRDLSGAWVMNRLIQGDVGSGKTVVAAALLYTMAKNGLQSALMAPTEILARQHYETLQKLLGGSVRVVLLTGGLTAREKREAKAALKSGEAAVAVGTHALLTGDVEFSALSLVVTDEQHRFGVRQRSTLSEKGRAPHVLVMSATPIPRTLSLMIYGDLDISVIDELPGGRKKILTYAVDSSYHPRVYAFLRKHLDAGLQGYVVCPAVEESESELLSAVEYAKELSAKEFSSYRVGLLHGKMKPKEKAAIMEAFAAGEIRLLVSTTVIEVGIDVPNAAVMVIENAERFGLSQLHQLRGRVGRGSAQSYCILISDAKGESAKARLEMMTKTNDGFAIAEFDLKQRGPGDFFGSRQHGLPELKIADLLEDMDTLQQAKHAALDVLAGDRRLEHPEHRALRQAVKQLFSQNGETSLN